MGKAGTLDFLLRQVKLLLFLMIWTLTARAQDLSSLA